ncbi:serine protease [Streptomyces sp. R-74717]|uniref:trypsin-like peptidase domain-containing protein n=1 Tax=Streptomyces TaxID=1883 RepID=UPI0037A5C5CF
MRLDVAPSLADAPQHRAFVSVLGRDQPVGAGVLLSPTLVLTCAHVINSALGRHRFDAPLPSRGQQIGLRFPHVDRERELIGRVLPHCWRPPRSRPEADHPSPPGVGALPYYGDLAVIELDTEAPPGAEPAPFLTHRDGNEVVAQWASGHALPTLRAMPRVSSHPWIALDVLGGTVAEGFSGGPLWDRERQAVVGLVVAAHESRARGEYPAPAGQYAPPAAMYAIGLSSIESELPGLPPVAAPAAGRGRQQLLGALEKLLPTRREVMACEERLAGRLGRRSSGPAADIERLAGMAMGVRRGVPELLNIVYEQLAELHAGSPAGAFVRRHNPPVQRPPRNPHRPAVRIGMCHRRQLPHQGAALAARQGRICCLPDQHVPKQPDRLGPLQTRLVFLSCHPPTCLSITASTDAHAEADRSDRRGVRGGSC